MIILGIESSCDDTSVALVEAIDETTPSRCPSGHPSFTRRGQFRVLAEKTASQIDVHKAYGGVVPEIAGRMHAEAIMPLIETVLHEANNLQIFQSSNLSPITLDVIAVTAGPGLITGLLVGVEAAKTLSYLWDIPLVRVNHIEGHMMSVLLPKKEASTGSSPYEGEVGGGLHTLQHLQFPALALVVSGGHTELILMKDFGDYEIIGRTRDDAAGECFDKVAKLLGLEYPGGPKISKLALEGRTDAIAFPRPMLDSKDYNFSFAGLKTSALYWMRDHSLAPFRINSLQLPAGLWGVQPEPPTINDFCASFEQAIVDVLVTKTLRAAAKYEPKTIIIGGGVSANQKLCSTMREAIQNTNLKSKILNPKLEYAMDNGAMIAVAGYFHAKKHEYTDWRDLAVDPNWRVDAC